MVKDIWVISDTHFGHENIIRYCDRPYQDAPTMDYDMIDRWNSVVKPQDKVYHLGDVYMGLRKETADSIFSKLQGHKRLILGNHDNGKDQILQKYFEKIDMWRMFPEFKLLLTHVPVHESTLRVMVDDNPDHKEGDCGVVKRQLWNVHGHIHQNKAPSDYHKCVCVEQINYTPIHIEELRMDG